MKCIRSTRGTNKWTSARSSHVELCRCFPVSLCQITAITGWCAVSKEPPHLWWIKGTMFWTSQLEADVLSPATLLYLQSPWHSKSVRSFDLSGVLGGGGVAMMEMAANELMKRSYLKWRLTQHWSSYSVTHDRKTPHRSCNVIVSQIKPPHRAHAQTHTHTLPAMASPRASRRIAQLQKQVRLIVAHWQMREKQIKSWRLDGRSISPQASVATTRITSRIQ